MKMKNNLWKKALLWGTAVFGSVLISNYTLAQNNNDKHLRDTVIDGKNYHIMQRKIDLPPDSTTIKIDTQ